MIIANIYYCAFNNKNVCYTNRIKRKLENFSDEDYLVLIGDPSAIGIVCAAAAAKNNGRFKLLKWDRREKLYVPIQIDLFYKGESDDY